MNDRFVTNWGEFWPNLPAGQTSLETTARWTFMLSKHHWNAEMARTFDQGHNSGYEAIESRVGLDWPFDSRDVKNGILDIDYHHHFVSRRTIDVSYLLPGYPVTPK